jgi:hypothetical protein
MLHDEKAQFLTVDGKPQGIKGQTSWVTRRSVFKRGEKGEKALTDSRLVNHITSRG